ncbi:ribonuclease E activity regulator RraA [Aquabacter sp. CN5-332]|uniref:ribonuclease E activity regulator RraA n=1 Tax=Aquabacter sp. CN5-332 TaxID=3156608 RepID=UPI0032B4AFF4
MSDKATTDLVDVYQTSGRIRSCGIVFAHFGGRRAFSGPIRTVKCHEDNGLIKQVLAEKGQGAVLVADGGGSLRSALSGDRVAGLAVSNGWAGMIIRGAVRDVGVLRTLDIGILALGSTPWRSTVTTAGEIDVPLHFGDAVFQPGGWVYADEDGLIVADGPLD